MSPKPLWIVVGYGRMGAALAHGLRGHAEVRVGTRPGGSRRAARAARFGAPSPSDWQRATGVLLAVPDDSVRDVAADIAPLCGGKAVLVHCAGALTLRPLRTRPLMERGSLHPLCAVSSRGDTLAGHGAAIAGSSPGVIRRLGELCRHLGLFAFQVPEKNRGRYHAAAVLAAGGMVTLAACAVGVAKQAGLSRRQAEQALFRLAADSLQGARLRGVSQALTGPWVRGDVRTTATHLRALSRNPRALYSALAEQSLGLLPKPSRQRLAKLLKPTR
ncbi:MAG: DUF2520 domain-containing protein [Myxococcaceae bacterium]